MDAFSNHAASHHAACPTTAASHRVSQPVAPSSWSGQDFLDEGFDQVESHHPPGVDRKQLYASFDPSVSFHSASACSSSSPSSFSRCSEPHFVAELASGHFSHGLPPAPVPGKKKRGRPPKYTSDAERVAAKREYQRVHRENNKIRKKRIAEQADAMGIPAAVLMEQYKEESRKKRRTDPAPANVTRPPFRHQASSSHCDERIAYHPRERSHETESLYHHPHGLLPPRGSFGPREQQQALTQAGESEADPQYESLQQGAEGDEQPEVVGDEQRESESPENKSHDTVRPFGVDFVEPGSADLGWSVTVPSLASRFGHAALWSSEQVAIFVTGMLNDPEQAQIVLTHRLNGSSFLQHECQTLLKLGVSVLFFFFLFPQCLCFFLF